MRHILLSLLLVGGAAQAQNVLADYDVTSSGNISENGYAARSSANGISASNISLTGVSNGSFTGHFHTTGWGGSQDTGKYISFTLTPQGGRSLRISDLEISIHQFGTSTAPTSCAVRTSQDGFASNVDGSRNVQTQSGTSNEVFQLDLNTTTSAVEIRIYFWDNPNGGWQGQVLAGNNVGMRVLSSVPLAPEITGISDDTGSSNADGITSDTSPTFSGNADDGTVEVFRGNSSIGTTTASGGTWSLGGTTFSPGSYTITATLTDAMGETSDPSAGFSLVIDTSAPSAPSTPDLAAASDSGSSNTDNRTNDTTPTFTGSAESGATVELFVDGGSQGTTTASGGTWSITAGTLTEGSRQITATATDVAGNTGAASAALTVVIDTSPPSAPSTPDLDAASDSGSSSADNLTNDDTPTFSGSAETDASVELFVDGSPSGSTTAGGGTWSITAATIGQGTRQITAVATDVAGNPSAASAALTVEIDTSPPAAPSTPDLDAASDSGRSDSDDLTNDDTPTFSGSAETDARVELFVSGSPAGSTTAGGGSWSLTTGSLTEGTYAITAAATDAAGNTGAASSALSVEIDTSAPDAPSADGISEDTGRSSDDQITADPTLQFLGAAEADSEVEVFLDGSSLGTTLATGGNWTYDHRGTNLADGSYDVTAAATDAAGNTGNTSTALTVVVDTDEPLAPSAPDLDAASDSGRADDDDLTNDTTPTLTGSAEGSALIVLSSDLDGVLTPVALAAPGGDWSVTLTSTLSVGVHTLTASAEDIAGNLSAASASLVVEIDTSTPAPTFSFERDTDAQGDLETFDRTLSYAGTAELDADFTLMVDGATVGSGRIDSTGAWTVDATQTQLGARTMPVHLISVEDAAGNTNQTMRTLSIVDIVDTDGDGLSDFEEGQLGTDPNGKDSDGDGLDDGLEQALMTAPLDIDDPTTGGNGPDADGDGIPDSLDSAPSDPDSNMNGVRDGYEVAHNQSLDLTLPSSLADVNGDGVIDNSDVPALLRAVSGTPLAPGVARADLDIDSNGRLDRTDVVLFVYFLRGYYDLLPIER